MQARRRNFATSDELLQSMPCPPMGCSGSLRTWAPWGRARPYPYEGVCGHENHLAPTGSRPQSRGGAIKRPPCRRGSKPILAGDHRPTADHLQGDLWKPSGAPCVVQVSTAGLSPGAPWRPRSGRWAWAINRLPYVWLGWGRSRSQTKIPILVTDLVWCVDWPAKPGLRRML
jgi:hypothetical protein